VHQVTTEDMKAVQQVLSNGVLLCRWCADWHGMTDLVSPSNHKNNWQICLRDILSFIFLCVWVEDWRSKVRDVLWMYHICVDKIFPVVLWECC